MGLKARLYVFLAAVSVLMLVISFTLLSLLARTYIEKDVEQHLAEVADLIAQDVVIANITDDYARLEQRFQYYAKLSYLKRVYWSMDGQEPLDSRVETPLTVPQWFQSLLSKDDVVLTQPVIWFGTHYGELRLEGDNRTLINNLWYFLLYLVLLAIFLVLLLVVAVEWMSKPIIQQILSLSTDALRIGSGNLHDAIRIGGSAEVLQLSLSMEQMRHALHQNREQQQQQQVVLHQLSRENEQRFIWLKNLFNTLPLAVLLEDTDGHIVFTNQLYCDFFKIALSPQQLIGYHREQAMNDTRLLFSDPQTFVTHTQQALTEAHRIQQLYSMQDGRWLLQDFIPMQDERSGRFVGRLWLYQDITQTHLFEQQLRWQATHDGLTGLYNRSAFEQQLQEIPKDDLRSYALLYIDLDQFKLINDTSGHAAGDELLQQVGLRIQSMLPKTAVLARTGGDEFAILIVGETSDAMQLAEALREMLANFRFVYVERYYQVGASIGVVPDVGRAQDAKMLMAMADAACYAAKNAGRNTVWLYQTSDAYLHNQREEMRVVSELHTALDQHQFEIYAQRLVPLQHDDHLLHLEILLRWKDVNGRPVAPDLFIPAAERYGLMHKIDRWVIEHTLTYLSEHEHLLAHISVCGINLSGASFSQPDLVEFVRATIERTQFPAHKLCFEITETAAVMQLDQAHAFIVALKALGCQFALDDFGSGQSSFRYLKQLPVDYLKIDGSFIRSMLDDRTNAALVRGMQEIAQALGMKTIAEFVETADIATALTAIEVDYGQGWYFHKAQPIAQLWQEILG